MKFYFFFLSLIIFTLIFFHLLSHFCSHLPYSFFFNEEANSHKIQEEIFNLNNYRLKQAKDFLKSYNNSILAEKKLDIAVGIISIFRGHLKDGEIGYLTQCVASLLQQETGKLLSRRNFFICNVNKKPIAHNEALLLSKYIPIYQPNESFDNAIDIFEKEKKDYLFCLSKAIDFNANYVLLLEDDVILRYSTTLNILSQIIYLLNDDMKKKNNWLFIKGYYPDKWNGYSYSISSISELITLSLVGGFLSKYFLSKCSNFEKTYFNNIYFIIGAIYMPTVCYLIGRPYLLTLRSLFSFTHHLIDSPGCCTQFMLYQSKFLHKFQDLLSNIICTKDYSVDLAIDYVTGLMGLDKWLIEPNIVKHIGYHSTLRFDTKPAAEFL